MVADLNDSTTQLYTLESRTAFAGWTQENLKTYAGPTPEVSDMLSLPPNGCIAYEAVCEILRLLGGQGLGR